MPVAAKGNLALEAAARTLAQAIRAIKADGEAARRQAEFFARSAP